MSDITTAEKVWVSTSKNGDYVIAVNVGDGTEYIRADLVPQWMPIETAPKDGTEFQALAKLSFSEKFYWVPCAKFETPQSRVPSAYLYESQVWYKFNRGVAAYWMPSVSLSPPPAT